ncbi:DNA double-strand break repair Rad50 ATPase [Metallosphaera sp. J1]|uniref:AAA family ATPase n=1 Tax=Metallosphaera javensis (ex Hofmann et al. 2022) TaxID=99938 RepID=UPI001EDCABCA|nr:AAA family ATPase [Metallosphaera javensis (ex Hofmann et al. 2022)]MCG3109222.1 DNA double-strand break repair Rad50 ATPase [Metallosphaera javensis (ex Hofmann et al. 2022)]
MRLESVSLKDFLSHERTTVSFKGDINVIVGQNGAGKSSIIEAIVFALFREGKGKQDEMVKKGKTTAEVELLLKDVNLEAKVLRKIPPGDLLYINGKLTARGTKEVTRKIEELGLNSKVVTSTMIVKQGEIETIFDNLTDVLKRVMMIDNLEKLTESGGRIKQLMDKYEMEVRSHEAYAENLKNFQEEKNKLEGEISSLLRRMEGIREEYRKLEEEQSRVKAEVKDLEEKQRVYDALISRKKEAEDELQRVTRELKNLEGLEDRIASLQSKERELDSKVAMRGDIVDLENKESRLAEKKSELTKLEKQRDRKNQELELKRSLEPKHEEYLRVKTRLEELEEYHEKFTRISTSLNDLLESKKSTEAELESLPMLEVEKIQARLDSVSRELDNVTSLYKEREVEQDQVRKSLAALLSASEGKCPVCGGPLDDLHREELTKKYSDRLGELSRELKDLERRLDSLKKEKYSLEDERERAREMEVKRRNKENELESLSARISQLQTELAKLGSLEEEFRRLQREKKELEKYENEYMKVQNASETEVEELEDQIAAYTHEIATLEDQIAQLREKVGNLTKEEVEQARRLLENIRKELQELQRKTGEMDNLLARKRELEKRINELSTQIQLLGFRKQDLELKKREQETLSKQMADIQRDIGTLEGKLTQLKDRYQVVENSLAQLQQKVKEVEKMRRAKERLEKLRKVLSEGMLQSYLISTLKGRIENNLNDIVSMFDISYTRILVNMTQTKTLTGKVELTALNQSGQQLPVNMLSGGEKIAVALALRLAIARALTGEMGFMILDEPTVHLDSMRRAELLSVIRESMNVVPQIIVVTHDDEVLRIADYVIRVEKAGDVSRVREEVVQ